MPAAWVDTALGKLSGIDEKTVLNRLVSGESWKADIKGLGEGWEQQHEGIKRALTGKTVPTQQTVGKVETGQHLSFGEGRVRQGLEKTAYGIFAIHEAADKPFRQAAYRGSLAELAELQARNEESAGKLPQGVTAAQRMKDLYASPPKEMAETAAQRAEADVFGDKNALSDGWNAFKRQMREHGGTLGKASATAADIIVPFSKVPMNIFLRMMEYTPLGGTYAAGQAANQLFRKSMTPESKRQFALMMGRGLTGSALMYLGYQLSKAGLMTGYRSADDRAGRELDKATGVPEMAIKAGDKWFRMNRISPLGNLLSIGAAVQREGDRPLKVIATRPAHIAAAALQSMMEMPFLQGSQGIIDAIQNPGSRAQSFAQREIGTVVPTMLSDIGALTDQTRRDIHNQGLLAGVTARIPGARMTLPPVVDRFNRPIPEGGLDILGGPMFDTFRTQTQRTDPVSLELQRTQAKSDVPRQDAEHNESDEVYRKRRALSGPLEYAALAKAIQTGRYRRADADTQRDILAKATTEARDELSALTKQRPRYMKADDPTKIMMLEEYLRRIRTPYAP
jgi:hypothetical protein